VSIRVRRYQEEDRGGIERLNARLAAGGSSHVVYPEGREQDPSRPVRERLFVAAEDGEIRGGVWLKEHASSVAGVGEPVVIGWLKYPVAESLVDARYSGVPGSLILQCLREQPRLLALGLGGHATPLARILSRLAWAGTTIPLQYLPVRPNRLLRELAPLRSTAARRAAADLLRLSGLGWLGWRAVEALRGGGRVSRLLRGLSVDHVSAFGPWADETWARCRGSYGFLTVRDAAMLAAMYRSHPDIGRLRVRRGSEDLGWACVVRHDFGAGRPDASFGRMTVGLVADALAPPQAASSVLAAATAWLLEAGVDIIISNQLHPAWSAALGALGFLTGPSNFALYRSPAASQLLDADAVRALGKHVNRGDCDGPIWYAPA
jgi:hypothetical protein